MDIEQAREYCLAKKGTTEGFPFDETALVMKVAGKMYALIALEEAYISLKCDPERAVAIREQYANVQGAYHMNKKHWNGVPLDGTLPTALVREWVDHSYRLVVDSLSKAQRASLEQE